MLPDQRSSLRQQAHEPHETAQEHQLGEDNSLPTPIDSLLLLPTASTEADTAGHTEQLSGAVVAALRSVVSKPDVYLIKAAQASTLRQLKTARKLLRDFNTAAKVELEQQVAAGQVAVQQLLQLRQDLDAAYACIRSVKQQLAEHHPDLYQQLQRELAAGSATAD